MYETPLDLDSSTSALWVARWNRLVDREIVLGDLFASKAAVDEAVDQLTAARLSFSSTRVDAALEKALARS